MYTTDVIIFISFNCVKSIDIKKNSKMKGDRIILLGLRSIMTQNSDL